MSSSQPIIGVPKRTHRVLPQNSVSFSEFSLPKQYSRNSIPPVSYSGVQYIIPFANWCENIVYCWCMTIILKDVLTELLATFGVHGFWASPGGILVFIGIIILLPVCSRECPPIFINSLVCAVGEIVLLLFMQLRYLDGSYMAGGQFFTEAGIRKLEETVDQYYVSPRTGVLVGMLMFNLAAHCP